MRITNSMVYASSLQQLQTQTAAQATASDQVSTGVRNALVSDDPAAAGQILRIDDQARANKQYQRNIDAATGTLNTEETTLNQLGDILDRASQLATQEAGSTASAASRSASAAEVSQLYGQVISLGNSKLGDQFVFGGNVTNVEPFQANGTYVGDNGTHTTQIGVGQTISGADSGNTIFVTSGVLSALQTLQTALAGNNATGIQNSLTALSDASDATQTNLAGVGAATNALTAATSRLTTQSTSLTASRSSLADISLAEASLALSQSQTALQAGLLATSKILSTSLVNYLATGTTTA